MWSSNVHLLPQPKGDTPLMQACANAHIKVAALLVEHGAILNHQNKVRLLYIHGQHDVAQNGVLSLE